jgi:YfiH family protein
MNWLTPDWPAQPKVRALSTLRGGGVSRPPYDSLNLGGHVNDAAAAVAENRRALRAAAGLPAEPQWLSQVHGTHVIDLDLDGEAALSAWAVLGGTGAVPPSGGGAAGGSAAAGRGGGAGGWTGPADAAVTRLPGRVCAILTADCLPVLLASESGDRVGAAHAGWRGLAAGVIEATVGALGGPPRELLAWLGPAIGSRHFEVGAEVREAFLWGGALGGGGAGGDFGAALGGGAGVDGAGADAAAVDAAFVLNSRGRYMADLYALARLRLARAGVRRVYGGGACTYAERDKYFSHRRDGLTGRQATLIWLNAGPDR